MTLSPDVTIADRFELEQRIAVGGMGEVWRARDNLLSRHVAVKVLKPEYAADPAFLQRFRAEARHAAGLSHSGVASVFDYGELGDMAYLVMECVDGEPLSAILAREGPLPVARSLDIVGQAGLALQAAHDIGVVHRDVKPGNLLVRPDGVVKVTDFGIARAIDSAAITQTGFVVGTAAYVSPEQAGGRPVTPASDIYSLGLVTYECLTGTRAFEAETPVATALAQIKEPPPPLPSSLPAAVAEFVTRALAKDPERRQPSAGDFGRTALALAAAVDSTAAAPTLDPTVVTARAGVSPTQVLPEAPIPAGTAIDDRQRRRVRNALIAVGVVVVLLGFLLLQLLGGGPRQVTLPRLTGETYTRAAGTLQTLGLAVSKKTTHDRRTSGTVLSQQPAAGTRLEAGSRVTLLVSTGPAPVLVRAGDYLGDAGDDAQATLEGKGLRVDVTSMVSSQPVGTVIGVNPTGLLKVGSTVQLTVAAAPPPSDKHGHDKGDGKKGGDGGD